MNMRKSKEQQIRKKEFEKKQRLWEETQARMQELYGSVAEMETDQVDDNPPIDNQSPNEPVVESVEAESDNYMDIDDSFDHE